jgi:hypothetical protein
MSRGQQQEFVRYNKILGKEASIGSIPANQVIPWILLTILAYVLTNVLANFGLGAFAAIAIWLVVSYWLLTGSKPYQYLDKWRSPPGKDWCNANKIYISLLPIPSFAFVLNPELFRVRRAARIALCHFKMKSIYVASLRSKKKDEKPQAIYWS